MQKRWVLKPGGDPATVTALAEELGVGPKLAELLVQRGINTYGEARAFFRPELSNLHDPFLMKDMDKAVERIAKALDNNEKILVYGDYDVDGTTAVSLVYTFLVEIGHKQIDFYIPDRYAEGYGISFQSVDFAAENGFKLVIALDCGIKAIEKVAKGKEKGVDYIICDHHRPGDTLPDAVAVLDAKRQDCPYPYKELSGCGVGFKLIQALASVRNVPFESLNKYLDLVVVSIASDIVPITGENRILAFYGLKLINQNPRAGFEAILKFSNINRKEQVNGQEPGSGLINGNGKDNGCFIFSRELTISDLVFLVGPRINAAGRIESGRNSVELLICEDPEKTEQIGQQINDFNTTRRDLDSNTTDMAMDAIKTIPRLKNAKTTVVYNPDWHKGVIGIVASRLIESYYRPTIVLTQSNGLITGSARSIKDFDIYDAIDECSELLEHFGGHKYAAGLSMKPENLEAFIEKFETVAARMISDEMLTPEVEVDLEINLNEINQKFFRVLKQFAPFGPGNMSPVFQTKRVIDNGYGRVVGKNHLKLTIGQPEIASVPFPAIAFQQGDHFHYISQGNSFNICYHIEENEWNNQKSIQLNIKDIKIPSEED
ncbi:MAG: DHH family phosphoesterase [Lentimicrobiaceae bacterium]|nr:DHH family phosphoesterase [Lentimicrobiaceae bacterium]MCB9023980.1 DHH family phosphoesterase [Lentimicrobiaceae bacterium]MCO5265591.1 DHHA1 domain-containing protein [Lentimicrobium sp.]